MRQWRRGWAAESYPQAPPLIHRFSESYPQGVELGTPFRIVGWDQGMLLREDGW